MVTDAMPPGKRAFGFFLTYSVYELDCRHSQLALKMGQIRAGIRVKELRLNHGERRLVPRHQKIELLLFIYSNE